MGVTDVVWSEQGTTPDAIEAALRQLLVEVHAQGREPGARARAEHDRPSSTVNGAGEIANRLRGVGRYHASRMLVLGYQSCDRERLDPRGTIPQNPQSPKPL